jgi:hypothetical protein
VASGKESGGAADPTLPAVSSGKKWRKIGADDGEREDRGVSDWYERAGMSELA